MSRRSPAGRRRILQKSLAPAHKDTLRNNRQYLINRLKASTLNTSPHTTPVNILCLKYGKRYPAHYVNRLYAGVSRNLRRPFQFYCCTDDAEGIHSVIYGST